MPDYTKAIIYRLVCKDLSITDCYVGSTTNFKHRKICHKSSCTNLNDKKYNFKIYEFIRDNGGWNNWDLIMVEEFPCDNKLQLHKREREVIETLKATLNSEIPLRTTKEYYEDNKEKIKQYRQDNKEKIKQYKLDNKETIKEYTKQYRLDNKEKMKQYREDNKEKMKQYNKQYREDNKATIKQQKAENIGCRICKCMVRKDNFNRHTKTPKHIKNLSAADQKC